MGKKAETKRKARLKAARERGIERRRARTAQNADYVQRRSSLEVLFEQYRPEDVCLALEVSELWLPNTSSQAKHCYALGIFLGMNLERFRIRTPINTYAMFNDFLIRVYELLPSFPMLEDYVPELDWGEVRVQSKGQQLKIFYGGVLERVPDFIEAFRITEDQNPPALDDLHAVLLIQDFVISHIQREIIGDTADVQPGHIEIPNERFWEQCRLALLEVSTNIKVLPRLSPALVLRLGAFNSPDTQTSFGEAMINGTALPAVLASVGEQLIPIWVRNLPSAVIDHWSRQSTLAKKSTDRDTFKSIADFLAQRFRSGDFIAGPFYLVTHSKRLPYRFLGALLTNEGFQLFIAIDKSSLRQLIDLESALRSLTNSIEEWAVKRDDEQHAAQFRNKNGALPKFDDLTVVVVIPEVTTKPGFIRLPKTKRQRVLPLPDFVTIMDLLDDADELPRFWSFIDDNTSILGGLSGAADLFGAFKDSHALLVDGAVAPSMIWLDPHWGTSIRFRQLAEFWSKAPALFPDDQPLSWRVEEPSDGIRRLEARNAPLMSWCTQVGSCVLHFIFDAADKRLDRISGPILELLVHCLADAVAHRIPMISGLAIFRQSRVVMRFCPDPRGLSPEKEESHIDEPLFSQWEYSIDTQTNSVSAMAVTNLSRVLVQLDGAVDASFEAECVLAWTEGLSVALGFTFHADLSARLRTTGSGLPRFTLKSMERLIDVPDYVNPVVPNSEQYKLARRDLAVTIKNLGAKPGNYQLGEAKAIIDAARDASRELLHSRISTFDRESLIRFSIEQIDALTAEYRHTVMRTRQSLSHEVSYNRTERVADAHKKFVHESRNYRYLLECCLISAATGKTIVTEARAIELLAAVDWLLVLYSASDVLHNDLDVAGLTLDDSFVPEVHYSELRETQEHAFLTEVATSQLGIGLDIEDEVSTGEENGIVSVLDEAFLKDVGVTFTCLQRTMVALSRWQAMRGEADLRLSYEATREALIDGICKGFEGMTPQEAEKAIDLAVLDSAQIKRLLGKTVDEADVPIWEHNKRGHRYTIRPLIIMDKGCYAWGAAAADRAAYIWRNSILNGYLPADFPWPHISAAVRTIKEDLERKLEVKAVEVVSRATQYTIGAIDFRKRFPKEGFEDVGDYDVLAFWPSLNRWLCVECKYNQPPFCIKDARRLRERIFGIESDHGQFAKIERRREFLATHSDRMRTLLGWPKPDDHVTAAFIELYVSRNIYWWMMYPPYAVPTKFVRVDGLDRWLVDNGLLGK